MVTLLTFLGIIQEQETSLALHEHAVIFRASRRNLIKWRKRWFKRKKRETHKSFCNHIIKSSQGMKSNQQLGELGYVISWFTTRPAGGNCILKTLSNYQHKVGFPTDPSHRPAWWMEAPTSRSRKRILLSPAAKQPSWISYVCSTQSNHCHSVYWKLFVTKSHPSSGTSSWRRRSRTRKASLRPVLPNYRKRRTTSITLSLRCKAGAGHSSIMSLRQLLHCNIWGCVQYLQGDQSFHHTRHLPPREPMAKSCCSSWVWTSRRQSL